LKQTAPCAKIAGMALDGSAMATPVAKPAARRPIAVRWAGLPLGWKVAAVSLALEAVVVALHALNAIFFNSGGFLDFSNDGNFPHWFTSAQFLLVAAAAAIAAAFGLENRRTWAGVALVSLALSAEAIVQLHERAEDIGPSVGHTLFFLEPLIGVVLVGLFAGAVMRLPRRSRDFVFAAAAALFLAELVPLLDDHIGFQRHLHDLAVIAEQWGEMLVATFLGAAVAEPCLRAVRGAVRRADGVGAKRPPAP